MADSIVPNYTLPPDAPWVMLMDCCVGGGEGAGGGAAGMQLLGAVTEVSLQAGLISPPSVK